MPVTPDSRYAKLPLLEVTAPDGSRRNVVGLRLESQTKDVQTSAYRVRSGDTVDFLARKFYGDEHLWWKILDANPAVYPLDIQAGDVLDLPTPGGATTVTRARRF
jgi:nucleoid-associated protein YgaU